ncbi:MAG: hypothetical protein KF760_06565 [Candidatus Eremiobacteraeota bacterium]|nr:hypothetical protein [Candidatus Eremiobacteraeota bacterium]MCW5866079.1 hypothetical protein [Candidatus Eremiobacteraeota bacterium]
MRSLFCCLLLLTSTVLAQSPRGVLLVVARDRAGAESLSTQLIAARDRAHLSENQLQVRRVLAQGWSPRRYQELGILARDLPLAGVARYSGSGKLLGLVGYPDFVEKQVSDPVASGDRLVKRWAEANGVALQPPLPLIRAVTVVPELNEPLPIGAEVLVTVQAESGGTTLLNSSSNRTLTLPEAGGGLYQGEYVVQPEEKGDIALIAHFSSARGVSEDKPVGHFQAIGWVPPQITAIEALGSDIYRVSGTAPPRALVKAKCHIDMGRFLFIGYSDYDADWSVQADDKGVFAFNMDLNQSETRRSDIDLEARFTLYAQNPDNEAERTADTEFTGKVRMTYQHRISPAYYGSDWGGYRSGFTFGLGYPGYGRWGGYGPWW